MTTERQQQIADAIDRYLVSVSLSEDCPERTIYEIAVGIPDIGTNPDEIWQCIKAECARDNPRFEAYGIGYFIAKPQKPSVETLKSKLNALLDEVEELRNEIKRREKK